MIRDAFSAFIYDPLYNGLVFLVGVMPGYDMGLAVIALTIIVRVFLFPLSARAIRAQMEMKRVAPEVEKLKETYKDKREELGRAIFALYREHNVRPFAGILLILVQIPILLGLYWVFTHGGLPEIDRTILYSFVSPPPSVDMEFLGLIHMSGHSLVLAILVAITQFIYTRLSMGRPQAHASSSSSFSADMAKSFDIQARYVLPFLFGGIAYYVVAAAPLFWVTSNLFMIVQEYLSGRRF